MTMAGLSTERQRLVAKLQAEPDLQTNVRVVEDPKRLKLELWVGNEVVLRASGKTAEEALRSLRNQQAARRKAGHA